MYSKYGTDNHIILKNTNTVIDRIIRFLEFGDNNYLGTGMFNNLKNYYNTSNLNSYYKLYCMDKLGYITNTKIISWK